MGCDRSVKLIDICKDRGFEVFVCDALKVPFRDSSFDLSMPAYLPPPPPPPITKSLLLLS